MIYTPSYPFFQARHLEASFFPLYIIVLLMTLGMDEATFEDLAFPNRP